MNKNSTVVRLFIFTFTIVSILSALTSCTDNARVRYAGGRAVLEIASDRKLVNITWKEEDLWILTKARQEGDTVKDTYFFSEKSSYGLKDGEYTIIEK